MTPPVDLSGDGSGQRVCSDALVRMSAVIAIIGFIVLVAYAAASLRGELAAARFLYLRRLAERAEADELFVSTVSMASEEADVAMRFVPDNPDVMWEIAAASRGWSTAPRLDPWFRLRLGEQSLRAALLGVRAVPSDYAFWLQLARTQTTMGLGKQAELSMARARDLAPPGKHLSLTRPVVQGQAGIQ
jgi:hypothetical protein